jgi:hypothetical protein
MNKFLSKLLTEPANHYRPIRTPLMDGFSTQEKFEYSPPGMQTLYQFILKFKADAWVSGDKESCKFTLEEIRTLVLKRLHFELFGEIESCLNELQLHFHNLDYDAGRKTIDIIKGLIKI